MLFPNPLVKIFLAAQCTSIAISFSPHPKIGSLIVTNHSFFIARSLSEYNKFGTSKWVCDVATFFNWLRTFCRFTVFAKFNINSPKSRMRLRLIFSVFSGIYVRNICEIDRIYYRPPIVTKVSADATSSRNASGIPTQAIRINSPQSLIVIRIFLQCPTVRPFVPPYAVK